MLHCAAERFDEGVKQGKSFFYLKVEQFDRMSNESAERGEGSEEFGIGIPVASCLVAQAGNTYQQDCRQPAQKLGAESIVHLHV